MEFGWSDEENGYRRALREFLHDELPEEWWSFPTDRDLYGEEDKARAKAFNGRLAARGWLVPHWPVEYGGRDASPWEHVILGEEMWSIGEPRGPQYMNVNWIGPAIMAYGTEEQKRQHLGRIAQGDVFWCQGFSEPDAGSDLASLKTAAVRDGDQYVVNGQKIWTSHCQVADWCFLLTRTKPDSGRDGITVLLVEVGTPGFEIRSLDGIIGKGLFHEMFFTDMRVPVANRLGPENEGWAVVRRALAFERVGSPRWERATLALEAVVRWARAHGRLEEPGVRARLGEARAACDAARLLAYAVVDERAHGHPPSAAPSVARVAITRCEHVVGEVAMEVLGAEAMGDENIAAETFINSLAVGVAAGTYEIQLNLVASQTLGLPRE
jgi:alkylation response protein AidB-like acyl-CoA dehydrogenase